MECNLVVEKFLTVSRENHSNLEQVWPIAGAKFVFVSNWIRMMIVE